MRIASRNVRLRPKNAFDLITLIARSQSDPRKARAELVQNSLDAGARSISVTRLRRRRQVAISILDDGTSRPDLMARRELKYVFTRHDVSTLRHVLRQVCRPIVHAGPVSTVRSVYFDDPCLSACRANLDGIGLRHKTRIRWYDREHPADRFFLETKWRRHRICGKHHVPKAVLFRDCHERSGRLFRATAVRRGSSAR